MEGIPPRPQHGPRSTCVNMENPPDEQSRENLAHPVDFTIQLFEPGTSRKIYDSAGQTGHLRRSDYQTVSDFLRMHNVVLPPDISEKPTGTTETQGRVRSKAVQKSMNLDPIPSVQLESGSDSEPDTSDDVGRKRMNDTVEPVQHTTPCPSVGRGHSSRIDGKKNTKGKGQRHPRRRDGKCAKKNKFVSLKPKKKKDTRVAFRSTSTRASLRRNSAMTARHRDGAEVGIQKSPRMSSPSTKNAPKIETSPRKVAEKIEAPRIASVMTKKNGIQRIRTAPPQKIETVKCQSGLAKKEEKPAIRRSPGVSFAPPKILKDSAEPTETVTVPRIRSQRKYVALDVMDLTRLRSVSALPRCPPPEQKPERPTPARPAPRTHSLKYGMTREVLDEHLRQPLASTKYSGPPLRETSTVWGTIGPGQPVYVRKNPTGDIFVTGTILMDMDENKKESRLKKWVVTFDENNVEQKVFKEKDIVPIDIIGKGVRVITSLPATSTNPVETSEFVVLGYRFIEEGGIVYAVQCPLSERIIMSSRQDLVIHARTIEVLKKEMNLVPFPNVKE